MLNSLYLSATPFLQLEAISSTVQFIKSGFSTVQACYETYNLSNPTKKQVKKSEKILTERSTTCIKDGLLACGVSRLCSYVWSQISIKDLKSLAREFSTTFSQESSQANPSDPRKLMTILRADLTNDPIEQHSYLFLNSQLPKWHQVFDVVTRQFDSQFDSKYPDSYSLFTLNNIFHNITRVGEQIKRISLLVFNGHGSEDALQLNKDELIFSYYTKKINWDDYLTDDAKIILLSCSTASGENSFAEQLSKIANRTVIAATEPIILPADIQYSPDLSSLSVEFFKQSLTEPAGARVFCPSEPCHGTAVITNDCLSGIKLISKICQEVLEAQDLSSIGLMYSLSVIGAGMTGCCLKGLNYAAKKTLGEGTWTGRIDSVASALTRVFNFHVNLVPNVCSGIYEGAKHLTQRVTNITDSTDETRPTLQNSSKKKKGKTSHLPKAHKKTSNKRKFTADK